MLRCVFHDAGTYDVAAENGGANASLRYETSRPENKGIKRGLNCVTEVNISMSVDMLSGFAPFHQLRIVRRSADTQS